LVSAINNSGAGVTASAVATSSGASQLSVTGSDSIQLYDGAAANGTDLVSGTGSGTEISTADYASAASTSVSNGTMTLVAGSKTYTFSLSGNNLEGLASAINSQNAGVSATVLTTGGGDYLSVSANQTGATTLALYDGTSATGTDLLTASNQGSDANFQLNGIDVSQATNTVNSVIPGVTFTLTGTSSTAATISLATDPSQISSALQSFVSGYNALQTAVEAQEGQNAGPLAGDSVVNQLQTLLNQMASYTNLGGGIQSLADLGVDFDGDTGQLSFDSTTFNGLNASQIQAGLKFLGSASTGFGAFSTQLDGFSDPVSGLIQSEINGDKQTDTDLQSQISTLQAQVTTMQTSLTNQLEAADAQQEELQNQQSQLNASLDGLNLVLYGKNTTSF
jgi:flagellar hook-associated protein 2